MDSDFFLIRKMRQGDEEAFDIFIRKYYGDILRYCACHCFDAEDAQDLTQETFVRFFSRFSDYRHKGKTKNYLYTIAGNLCKNYYKKNKAPAADDVYGESRDTTESLEDSVIERAALEWALDHLEPELRDVIDLYYFRELETEGDGRDTVCHTDHPGAVEEQSKLLHGDRRIDLLCPSSDIFGENPAVRSCGYSAVYPFLLHGGSLPADIPDRTADTVYLSNDSYSLYLFRNLWEQKSGQ